MVRSGQIDMKKMDFIFRTGYLVQLVLELRAVPLQLENVALRLGQMFLEIALVVGRDGGRGGKLNLKILTSGT